MKHIEPITITLADLAFDNVENKLNALQLIEFGSEPVVIIEEE